MFWFDQYYFILVLPAVLLAMLAQANVSSTFAKFSKIPSSRGKTGREAAEQILRDNGIYGVTIERIGGKLADHYDPRKRVIRLSGDIYDSTSVAALGIAAHEAGHAVQHEKKYFFLKIRNAVIPVTQIGSTLSWPLIIAGLIFSMPLLVNIGIMLFAGVTLFQLITLPVEFNASGRALKALEETNMLDESELGKAKKVLNAAAMTYVAALAVSLANMFRLILLTSGRRR